MNALEASDEILIGRIAGGDRLAMQALYARHHVKVFRFVLRLVRNEASAEDLISEVFLDVWRQAARFEGRSAVSTWILAIARFKALSSVRRRKEAQLDEEEAEAIEDEADKPEVALQKKDKGEVCASAWPALDPITGRSSISSTTTRNRSRKSPRSSTSPENTVKTRMFYARKKLAELLKQPAWKEVGYDAE